ncbi:molybdopterin synthase [Halospeciosus flavus]|uniref:Molybdopterin synthase n=1 Tax=Halospeciosus flavus TaxID=3032283 RepID=A0ABD5Z847_9EURY|nr:molybdopterin synthase [Halospeciosus flavus]
MYVLGISTGTDVAVDPLVDRLADRFADEGSVAVVRAGDVSTPDRTTYTVDGTTWTASGTGHGLDDVLDELAPDHDYALVVGFEEARVPHVAVGQDVDVEEPLRAALEPAALDVEALVDALHDTEPRETLASLVAEAKRSPEAEYAGAIATFTGRVRAKDEPDDARTTALSFEKYEGVADERMTAIERELTERDGVHEVVMHHRTGVVEYGEDIVFVVVLAGHRGEAFETVEDGINRLKDEVPLFKKEVTVEDEFWVHDRSE